MKAFSIVHLGSMLIRRTGVAALALMLAGTGAMDVGSALADDNNGLIEYRYLVGTGLTELGNVCDLGVDCPTAATAPSNGDTIQIIGEGKLTIGQNGGPESVRGGGSFLHKSAAGNVVAVGTWTASRLLSFNSFGPGVGTPPTWEAGIAKIRVQLAPDSGGRSIRAILEVGCLLPGITPPPGAFEGVKLNVLGLLNFSEPIQPRATLFINLGTDGGNDD